MHVPVWHAKMQEARDRGRIRMLGIVEEQHAERARLFKQWKGLDWPILYDPFQHLEVAFVPIMLGIDEWGVIRKVWPAGQGADQVEAEFIAADFPPPATPDVHVTAPAARDVGARTIWRDDGGAGVDDLIATYEQLTEAHPDDGFMHFRLGVSYRLRHDTAQRAMGDFQNAVRSWAQALEIDPNNYIWRRRLQQYGPRAAKPYPFYDWIEQAGAEIRARGETPVELAVQPGASERARPGRTHAAAPRVDQDPDPSGRIHRDAGGLILVETTCVPARVPPAAAARLHVSLRPKPGSQAHWNNEVEPLLVWVDAPSGWTLAQQAHVVANPPAALSREERIVEVDVVIPADTAPGRVELPAHALYYVCEDVQGACLYRRQDLALRIEVGTATPRRNASVRNPAAENLTLDHGLAQEMDDRMQDERAACVGELAGAAGDLDLNELLLPVARDHEAELVHRAPLDVAVQLVTVLARQNHPTIEALGPVAGPSGL
jgi:hypothetical protein